MNFTKTKDWIIQYIYILGVALYIAYYYLYLSYIWHVENQPVQVINWKLLFYGSLICFLIKIVLTKYKWYELIVIVATAVLMYVCWKHSGGIDYPVNCLIIFGMKNVDLRKVIKVVLFSSLLAICYGMTWTFLNMPDTIAVVKDYGRGMVETRFRFCIWNANALNLLCLTIMLCFLYLYCEKCKWWVYFIVLFLYYHLFLLTKSRTSFFAGVIGIIMFLGLRYGRKIFQSKLIMALYVVINFLLILTPLILVFFNAHIPKLYIKVNQMLTGRLDVAQRCVTEGGIHLFGSNMGGKVCGYGIYTQSTPGYVTELGSVRTFLEYGHIVFILFLVFILFAIFVLHRSGDYAAVIMLTIALTAFSFEAYFPAAYNMKAFILGFAFFKLKELNFHRKRNNELKQ